MPAAIHSVGELRHEQQRSEASIAPTGNTGDGAPARVQVRSER
jgi:hypothetical protein